MLCALVGIVESAPAGIPVAGRESYFYVVSYVPYFMLSLLVVAQTLLKERSKEATGEFNKTTTARVSHPTTKVRGF